MRPRIGSHRVASWGIVLLTGYVSTIAAVWGYDIVACRGVFAGIASALLRLAFLVFVSPTALVAVVASMAVCSAAGLALGWIPVFRERKELLLFLLPVATFLVGLSVASNFDVPVRCALSPWR